MIINKEYINSLIEDYIKPERHMSYINLEGLIEEYEDYSDFHLRNLFIETLYKQLQKKDMIEDIYFLKVCPIKEYHYKYFNYLQLYYSVGTKKVIKIEFQIKTPYHLIPPSLMVIYEKCINENVLNFYKELNIPLAD